MTGFPSQDKPWLKYYEQRDYEKEIPYCNLFEFIYRRNKDFPKDIALEYYGSKISYGEFFCNVKRTAAALAANGLKKGDYVTFFSVHTPEMLYCLYAANYIGAVSNLVYTTLSSNELIKTVRKTNSKFLFVFSPLADKVNKIQEQISAEKIITLSVSTSLPKTARFFASLKSRNKTYGEKFISYEKLLSEAKDAPVPEQYYSSKEPALVVYTSGSTGEPKGVLLSSDNINQIAFQQGLLDSTITRGDGVFALIPPFIIYGFNVGIHVSLTLGAKTILWLSLEPKNFYKGFYKTKPQHAYLAPHLVMHLVKNTRKDLSFLKSIGGGGESFSKEQEALVNKNLKLMGTQSKYLPGYGMTETGPTAFSNSQNAYKENTLGVPLVLTNVKIINTETGEEQKYNETGEITINSPGIMLGYADNQTETEAMISTDEQSNKWLHTGDLGFVDEEGFVHIVGRIKRIYLIRDPDGNSLKMFPQRIEDFFKEQNEVKDCGVIVIKDEVRLFIPIVFIQLKNSSIDKNVFLKKMKLEFKNNMPSHIVYKEIRILDELPLTQSGKINYTELEKIYNAT